MSLREWWRRMPWDARCGYATAGAYAALFTSCVVVGPNLLLGLAGCLTVAVLALSGLALVIALAATPPRRCRVLPLVLVTGSLASHFALDPVEFHLISRVYRSGGPDALSDWAQDVIRGAGGQPGGYSSVDEDRVPPGVRANLPGRVLVGTSLWSGPVHVRIELGGGFYHYGVVVYQRGDAPPPMWWQRALGWPPEVVVYYGD